jgi:hypothetical protein
VVWGVEIQTSELNQMTLRVCSFSVNWKFHTRNFYCYSRKPAGFSPLILLHSRAGRCRLFDRIHATWPVVALQRMPQTDAYRPATTLPTQLNSIQRGKSMKTNRVMPQPAATEQYNLLLGALLASMLAACGGGSEGAATTTSSSAPTVPAAVPVPNPAPAESVGMQALAPLSLPISTAVQTLATSNLLAFAIKADGSLWAWGDGTMGELGDGERLSLSPSPIKIGEGYRSVATGSRQNSIGVKADGTLWAWGLTHPYALGIGPQNYFPIQIGTGYAAVSAGANNYALKLDGTLWAWGGANSNNQGELGDGTTVDRLVPVQIGTGFVAASAGCYHAAALKSDGTVWTWGNSGYGQLGNGSVKDAHQNSPIQVGTGFVSIAAGCTDTFGVRADGAVWAWGGEAAGQLGDGVINSPGGAKGTPFRLPGNFTTFGAGLAHTLAVKADGSLWEWGNVIGMKASEQQYPNGYPVQVGVGFK